MDSGERDLPAEVSRFLRDGDIEPAGALRFTKLILASARKAGAKAVIRGHWLSSLLLELAAHVRLRDRDTLEAQYGRSGEGLTAALVTNAARASAAIGAAFGALATVAESTGVGIAALPAPVLADAVLTALVEMKLIGELHAATGHPLPPGAGVRALALARAWAEGRGVRPDAFVLGGAAVVSGAARRELSRALRRRLARRTGRSLTTLAPLLVGAAAAAQVNRRGTRKMALAVIADLAVGQGKPLPPSN